MVPCAVSDLCRNRLPMEKRAPVIRKLILFTICLGLSPYLQGQSSSPEAQFLPGSPQICKAELPDGTRYDAYSGVLQGSLRGQTVYVDLRAYYRPGTGEFLWWEDTLSEHGYRSTTEKERSDSLQRVCSHSLHIVELRDSEWADFWAQNNFIAVHHSNLSFGSIELAWQYVAKHWRDSPNQAEGSTKWLENINLYKALGGDFFRPERLR